MTEKSFFPFFLYIVVEVIFFTFLIDNELFENSKNTANATLGVYYNMFTITIICGISQQPYQELHQGSVCINLGVIDIIF